MAGMPWFIYLIGSGFSQDPEKLALAVDLTRITFHYLLFMAVVALLSGVPNSLYRFAAAAAPPILPNVLFLAAPVAVPLLFPSLPAQVNALAVLFPGPPPFAFTHLPA